MNVRASVPKRTRLMREATSMSWAALASNLRGAVRLRYGLPILIFAALTLMLAWELQRDPRTIPSALIGQPVPGFTLPTVKGHALGLASSDLAGEVSLVNVFASWCMECRTEHPLLLQMKADAVVPIHGLNYKDAPDDAARWLNTFGDPYKRTGADRNGRVAIDWASTASPRPS